jgi:hypothetical protein
MTRTRVLINIVGEEEEAAGQPWGGVPVVTARKSFPTDTFDLDRESADFHITSTELVGAVAPRRPSSGTESLMMAILEDALRCYLGPPGRLRTEAECWVLGTKAWTPFSFPVVCEALGFSPDTLRAALRHLQSCPGACDRIGRRLRPNSRRTVGILRPQDAPVRGSQQVRQGAAVSFAGAVSSRVRSDVVNAHNRIARTACRS